MRLKRLALLCCVLLAACHRPTEVSGIYVSQDGSGTLFPCTNAKVAILVPDTTLALRYQAIAHAPSEPVYVRLRGVNTRSGSIYDGRRYFLVQQIVEVRPRAEGECPLVAHPVTSVLRP